MQKLLALLGCALVVPFPLAAQQYSIAGANQYVARKDWRDLLAYSQAWTRATPGDPMAWYYLGNTEGTGFNQQGAAAAAFQHAVSLKPQWPEAWHSLAISSLQCGQYAASLTAAQHAVSQNPSVPNYWNDVAAAQAALANWNAVSQTLQQEQQHMADATSYDWYNLGGGYSRLMLPQPAIAAYTRSLQMNRNDADAWNNLGVEEEIQGQYAAALQDYQRAAQLGDSLGASNASRLQQANASPHRTSRLSPSQRWIAIMPMLHNWGNTPTLQ